ncbi:MAG: hypothetical protein ABIH23_21885, partial [bacterium]
ERGVAAGEMVEHLYECLEPYLSEKGIDLTSIPRDEVTAELEKRVLRWVTRKDINISAVSGLSVCQSCKAMIMQGRTLCNNCAQAKGAATPQQSASPSESRPVSRGMHTRGRR